MNKLFATANRSHILPARHQQESPCTWSPYSWSSSRKYSRSIEWWGRCWSSSLPNHKRRESWWVRVFSACYPSCIFPTHKLAAFSMFFSRGGGSKFCCTSSQTYLQFSIVLYSLLVLLWNRHLSVPLRLSHHPHPLWWCWFMCFKSESTQMNKSISYSHAGSSFIFSRCFIGKAQSLAFIMTARRFNMGRSCFYGAWQNIKVLLLVVPKSLPCIWWNTNSSPLELNKHFVCGSFSCHFLWLYYWSIIIIIIIIVIIMEMFSQHRKLRVKFYSRKVIDCILIRYVLATRYSSNRVSSTNYGVFVPTIAISSSSSESMVYYCWQIYARKTARWEMRKKSWVIMKVGADQPQHRFGF